MLAIRITDTHHIMSFGAGYDLSGARVIHREVDEATFRAELTALHGWAGDERMVVVDTSGRPLRYEVRALTPEEEAADARHAIEERERQARDDVLAIAGWATWTEAGAIAWIDANVTDLASAITALKAMARMVIAVRNRLWPDLEGSS